MSDTGRKIVLRAQDIGMTFAAATGGVEAIRKVDFELYEGETLAIVGPSGCGKSTLFNIISGLLEPTRGHVEVNGRRVEQATGHVGYMLQRIFCCPAHSAGKRGARP